MLAPPATDMGLTTARNPNFAKMTLKGRTYHMRKRIDHIISKSQGQGQVKNGHRMKAIHKCRVTCVMCHLECRI